MVTDRDPMPVDCVVLAGQANSGPFQDMFDVPNEALVPAAGYPLLTWVLAALRGSRSVHDLVVVGPAPDLQPAVDALPGDLSWNIQLVEPGETITDNISRGVAALQSGRWILVCTADIPLLTPGMVDAFTASIRDTEADFYYPVATRGRVEEAYPGMERTYVRVSDQVFTGGNLFLVRPEVVGPALRLVDVFFKARKNPLRLASILGLGFIFRFLTGRLALDQLERKVSGMVGATGRVVISPHPEVGIDVDKPSHLPPVEGALMGRAPGRWVNELSNWEELEGGVE